MMSKTGQTKDWAMQKAQLIRMVLIAVLVAFFCVMLSDPASAVVPPQPPQPEPMCTDDPAFSPPLPANNTGLISTIVIDVQTLLNTISGDMYNVIVGDGQFVRAIRALMSIYIAVYGVMFTFAMVQMTLHDFAMRMIKIGIMMLLISPNSWAFFSDTVVRFFNMGTDDIINQVSAIALFGVNIGGRPFAVMDAAILNVVSARMAVTLLAMVVTGPYGLMFFILMLMALFTFVTSLLTALWVYLMGLVLRTLLFGLAPLFIACLLFNRTRHLFNGWLNQIVNSCLQPIMLFTFYAFFIQLILAAINNILGVPVCWTPFAAVEGAPQDTNYWRFKVFLNGDWQQYWGEWGWTGPSDLSLAGYPDIFPIRIMDILIFLAFVELASRFNGIVLEIAKDLAGASTSLATMSGSLSEWFSPGGGSRNVATTVSGGRNRPVVAPGRAGGNRTGSTPRNANEAAAGLGSGNNLSNLRQQQENMTSGR